MKDLISLVLVLSTPWLAIALLLLSTPVLIIVTLWKVLYSWLFYSEDYMAYRAHCEYIGSMTRGGVV